MRAGCPREYNSSCQTEGSIGRGSFLRIANHSHAEGAPGSVFRTWVLGWTFFSLLDAHAYQPNFALLVKRPTAPRPVVGMFRQSSNDWIRVHIVQLLPLLPLAINVEIVETCLPECA